MCAPAHRRPEHRRLARGGERDVVQQHTTLLDDVVIGLEWPSLPGSQEVDGSIPFSSTI